MKPYCKELEKLILIFKKAEAELIKELLRQQSLGLVDYHTQAQLLRVRKILQSMAKNSFKLIPKIIKEQFLIGKRLQGIGYKNAMKITNTGYKEIQELVKQLENRVVTMSITAENEILKLWLNQQVFGRLEDDLFRQAGLKGVIEQRATGGMVKARKVIAKELIQQGITAFIDKAGRRWRLNTYGEMVARTTGRQATNMGAIDNDNVDLYKMSEHYGSCPICAPLQGRVYSKSGTNPNYPPLAKAFAKIDKYGADTLDNTYMTIHPNCLHVLKEWTEMGLTDEEIKQIRDFSSFEKNPITINPQSQKEIEEYRQKVRSERWIMDTHKQWERYSKAGINVGWETFKKHKRANSEKYKAILKLYRNRVK